MKAESLEQLARLAIKGDASATEALVCAIKDDVYGLALRMLWHPADAEDACQEIIIKVLTQLGGFRGESALKTWVFRVATNHLLNVRKSRAERERLTFNLFSRQLREGLSAAEPSIASDVDQGLLVEEVKIGCTQGMLLCLDREHRLAYILGEVFEVTGEEGAAILCIEPPAYRKRLSRARQRVRSFMKGNCGLVNASAACRCEHRVQSAVRTGRVDPHKLLFASHPVEYARASVPSVRRAVQEMEELHRAAAVLRSNPRYVAPDRLVARIRTLLNTKESKLIASDR